MEAGALPPGSDQNRGLGAVAAYSVLLTLVAGGLLLRFASRLRARAISSDDYVMLLAGVSSYPWMPNSLFWQKSGDCSGGVDLNIYYGPPWLRQTHLYFGPTQLRDYIETTLYRGNARDIRVVLCEALGCPIFVEDRRPAEVDAMGTDHHHRYPGVLHNLSHRHQLCSVPTNKR